MKKILFVDDEQKVLQGLQRTLRPMRHEWEMEFVSSGQEALEMLSKMPFDVIVTDMRMPGMDGLQLLKEVMKKNQNIVRIVLSGQTEHEAFLSSDLIAHRFMSKPCDVEALKVTIAQACKLENLLADETLKKIVLQLESLPTLPSLYTEIVDALQSPNTSIERIGQIISKDIGMTAKVLKLVNSAFFGLRRKISSPTEAVVFLGLNTIKALVLSYSVFSAFDNVKLRGFSDNLWRHSLLVGSYAKQIATAEKCESRIISDALIAGMLHDIGKLILAANVSELFTKAITMANERKMCSWDAEQEIFHGTHAEVGAYLIGLWGVSDSILEAIAFHHAPLKSNDKTFNLVTALHVADVFGNEAYPVEYVDIQVDNAYISNLGLAERLSVWKESCIAVEKEGGVNV
jgi:HD-like signal output (HDOD) protein